ncbi:endopeptidase La [Desulfoferrobacter suflitae]|uniref:endopeptidase La n=1 Tax=Desulfoferrobacter suflitae TaxID=2865782 RepID=UPI00216409D9|nr:endopeptidase La [Desulfoferrobacter suflitae]MCK8603531.1 endopeptidase La [Desulfoferrobacter suflitae]
MALFRKSVPTESSSPAVTEDLAELRAAIDKAHLPEQARTVADREFERLEKMDVSIPEYAIGLNYLDFLLALPWHAFTEDNLDLHRAEDIMETQHYGIRHVKERMLEYLAVRTLCSTGEYHILVVDDEEIARTNMQYVLQKEGYLVRAAANGLEALAEMKQREFDLILTDLKMEKMDGIQLLESAKHIAPHTQVVLITGFATVSSAVAALKKGAAHYLPKPIDLEELRSTVRQLHEKKRYMQMTRSPILCFSGPPGTGKTSIGRSIAEALERKFVRISLAALRDEADLRGHRRTYVGAMPGRILNEIKRLGVRNPIFMLDEIDKIGQDFRGDPASVLLEILDPEQNSHFIDHYLDLPFDLSSVMFIATANVVERLPAPLLDRLEVIPFPGYTEKEKKNIARKYLIPRQLREHGLSHAGIGFSDEAVVKIIRDYTLEAGLRNLERQIATVCRKLARLLLQSEGQAQQLNVDEDMAEKLLGVPRFTHEIAAGKDRLGVTTGLVWTEFGGEIIAVEATMMKGSQQLILTGSLGNVLQESAQTALSYIRSNASRFALDAGFFDDRDIHIHIPAGAIPKDGPSAGLTITLALLSLLTNRPARRAVALSGEITLSGNILPVSGIREKILAAQRAGVKTAVFPLRNKVDVDNLEEDVKQDVKVVLADEVPQLLDLVLV